MEFRRVLFRSGIVRVCSVGEPTQESGRWQVVGTCGLDANKKSRGDCWLDIQSAKIDDLTISSNLRSDLQKRANPNIQLIDSQTGKTILTSLNEQRNSIIAAARSLINKAKKTQPRPVVTISPPPIINPN